MVKPMLVSIVSIDGRGESALLALAAGAACGLEAPLGNAILDSARERNLEVGTADQVQERTGAGVMASVDGKRVVVGDAMLFSDLGLSIDRFGKWPERLRQRGEHVLFVAVDGHMAGFLGVMDSAS